MKKNILNSALAVVFAILLASCSASHSGTMANSASLGAPNFSYVKQNIKGESSAVYILGIGGLAKATLVDDAKQKMLAENSLKSNQTLANLTVNFKCTFYFGFYSSNKCTVTADIVEFK